MNARDPEGLQALVFDVDGTVAETEELHRRAFNGAFARHGIALEWDAAEYRRLLRVAGGKERIAHALGERQAGIAPGELAAVHATKTALYAELLAAEGAPWRPGVLRLMRDARRAGLRLALATTTTESSLDPLFAPVMGAGWRSAFAAIVAGDAVPRKKPAPDVYREVVARLATRARACIAFEDSQAGVRAARGAGCAVVATRSQWLPDDDLAEADLRLEHLGDLDCLWPEPHPLLRSRWAGVKELVEWHRRRLEPEATLNTRRMRGTAGESRP